MAPMAPPASGCTCSWISNPIGQGIVTPLFGLSLKSRQGEKYLFTTVKLAGGTPEEGADSTSILFNWIKLCLTGLLRFLTIMASIEDTPESVNPYTLMLSPISKFAKEALSRLRNSNLVSESTFMV